MTSNGSGPRYVLLCVLAVRWFFQTFDKLINVFGFHKQQELCKVPRLVVEGVTCDDLCEGELGNSWFVSACSALAKEPKLWHKVRTADFCGSTDSKSHNLETKVVGVIFFGTVDLCCAHRWSFHHVFSFTFSGAGDCGCEGARVGRAGRRLRRNLPLHVLALRQLDRRRHRRPAADQGRKTHLLSLFREKRVLVGAAREGIRQVSWSLC